ncbi:phage major capsid protein [Arthrobacter sp. efr-133-R2A-63]|uniref:phage major capsid protein n=1 Tax=Arthrobacter sp. efr-133-R2A-63 TaxID=3040278 RepID=UPI0025516F0F|nr:phage major capsid protein [Arthrobacter sp. efr-133-R2A-63]
MSITNFQQQLKDLSSKADSIVGDPSLTNVEKKAALDRLIKTQENVIAVNAVRVRAKGIYGAMSGDVSGDGGASVDPDAPRRGKAVPKLNLSTEVAREAFARLKSHAGFAAELGLKDAAASTVTDGQLPPAYIGLVQKIHEPTRLLALLQTTSMSSPSVEYIQHTSTSIASNAFAAPVLSSPTTATTGGFLLAGTYKYVATYTSATGETVASNEVSQVTTGSTSTASFTIGAAPSGATGTKIYRTAVNGATGTETLLATLTSTPTSYTDTGATAPGTAVPPTINGTGTAGMLSPGGTYVEAIFNTSTLVATAQKVGVFTTTTDELLKDFSSFAQYIESELQRLIIDQENFQLLNGNGSAPNLKGLLQTPGLLTRANPSAGAMIDTIEQSVADLRNGPSYCEPDVIVLHPNDWSLIRRIKTTQGVYVLGDPGQTAVNDIWGITVATTTQIPQGTGLLMNTELIGVAYVREGVTLSMSNSDGNNFTSGKVAIRADERLALAVARPSAGLIITGIA